MTLPHARRTRRTSSWGLALAAVATVSGLIADAQATEAAASTVAAAPSAHKDRTADIAAAARAYGVPASVLSAYAYAQTRWDDHRGAPSTDGGYGPAHLVDGSALETGGRDGGGPGDPSGRAAKERIDTLGRAARLTGLSRARLRTDPAANLRGAAALLADTQRRLHRTTGTGTPVAAWYTAIARTAPTDAAGVELADAVMSAASTGARRVTSDGARVALAPAPVGAVTTQRLALVPATARRRIPRPQAIDCPATLACEWLPAPYVSTGPTPADYGNHDIADRPASPAITTIVIHDTEGYYRNDVSMVQDPTYLAWQYTIRSSDGHVAQHLGAKDIGWQAGNWYTNMHSIGVEHEGFAAQGATWFSEPMYRSSAALVKHLATEYHVPLDRGHIIGHDQVPGSSAATTPTMHWDPGPYWDWEHYFALMGAPLTSGTAPATTRPRAGQAVRVLPTFATNVQPLTGCTTTGVRCSRQGSNILPVRTAPATSAPLLDDIGFPASTANPAWAVQSWGAKAATGLDYVVADVQGDWVAIWFAGRQGWVYDPASAPTLRVVPQAFVATPKGATAATYGRAYPEASAYPAGETPQPVVALPYALASGQSYAVLDAAPPTDYYAAHSYSFNTPNDHRDIVGTDRYLLVSLGHRLAYVRAADVVLRTAR